MRVLFLSSWFPYPLDNGSKIRIYNLLKGLGKQHEVTLLAFYRVPNVENHLPALRDICQKIEVVRWKAFRPKSARSMMGFVSARPRSVIDTFSPQMQLLIEAELVGGRTYDAIIASELPMAAYQASFDRVPSLLEDLELATAYDSFAHAVHPFRKIRNGLTWLKLRRYVAGLLEQFKVCTVVSEKEKEILSSLAPRACHVEVVPNCLDIGDYKGVQPHVEPGSLIFTGSLTYSPNYDAVCFFLRDIYPLVKAAVPDVSFSVTGRADGVRLPKDVEGSGVQITGYVDDVKTLVANSCVSVVPLREGSGTRLKVLEALVLGTPVVSTSKGAEGLDVQHGRHLMIADTPQTFADHIVKLLNESSLRAQLGENSRRLVRERYSWEIMMPRFLHLVESL